MTSSSYIFSALTVLSSSALLVVTGLLKRPGIGILATLLIMGATLCLRRTSPKMIGFRMPLSWWGVIGRGFFYAVVIYAISTLLVEPISEIITQSKHDYSNLDGIRGNWLATIQLLLVVWIFVAVIEETIYRGFLMTELSKITGNTSVALVFGVVFTSVVFGFSHGYQSLSGVLSTGAVGAMLACVFIVAQFSLWEAIIAHGFIDTIGILLITTGGDILIRENILAAIWKLPSS